MTKKSILDVIETGDLCMRVTNVIRGAHSFEQMSFATIWPVEGSATYLSASL